MDFVFSMLMDTAAIPIVVAVAIAAVIQRSEKWKHRATTIAVASGFVAGWIWCGWWVWPPKRYIDWMPIAALILLVVPYVAPAPAVWLLVPPFAPSRPFTVGLITVATYAGDLLLEKVTDKSGQRLVIGVFMAVGTACSIVLALSFSLKFAQISGLLAAALTPGLLWINSPNGSVKGLAMLFYGLMCNLMFIGYANTTSDVPTACFALPLLAPLILKWNPSSPSRQKLRLAAIAGVLLLAVVPALLAHPPWEGEME